MGARPGPPATKGRTYRCPGIGHLAFRSTSRLLHAAHNGSRLGVLERRRLAIGRQRQDVVLAKPRAGEDRRQAGSARRDDFALQGNRRSSAGFGDGLCRRSCLGQRGCTRRPTGARNWTKTTHHAGAKGNIDYGWITQWGSTVECIAISPAKPDRVVFGTSGHVFLTDDAGSTWQHRYCRIEGDRFRGNGLEVTCLNDIVPDPMEPGRLYFCYFDIGW